MARLRDAGGLLDASPGTRDAYIRHVLALFLGWEGELVSQGNLDPGLVTAVPEHGTEVRPDFALLPVGADLDRRPLVLGLITDPGTRATARGSVGALPARAWNASPADKLAHALRAQKVALGLVTDGTEWTLVCAPAGGATTTATWTRHTWIDEPETLKAFHALLGRMRFFGVPETETLPALLAASLERQEEITERLSEQSQAVVEMLVATIGRLDADHRAQHGTPLLPIAVEPVEVYQAAVTILMRLIFLLYAEERGLLPLDDDTYANAYAASTLAGQLRERASDAGEDTLERSSAGWHRLLATFRAVHRGARHDQLSLPGYGGSLFDPDHYPWLEGRSTADAGLSASVPLGIDDRTLLRALEALQWLRFAGERRRVSFRVLDVEQIGYVYEGLLDQDARRAEDWVLGIAGDQKGEKDGPELALSDLQRRYEREPQALAKWLAPQIKNGSARRSPASIEKALASAPGDAAWTGVLEASGGDVMVAEAIMPFAGLLRRDPRDLPVIYRPGSLYLTDSDLRANTGAVYTPRVLAEQVVENALEPLVFSPGPLDIEDKSTWRIRRPEEILGLKVIDIAAGSGAFLVGATRYLADRLLDAEREYGGGPADLVKDEGQQLIDARRRVVDHCIYGIDINPMAVEMAKLSLWLVTLDKQRPFTFLDDRLAAGDSLLGLTSLAQLTSLHLDPSAGRDLYREGLPLWTSDIPALVQKAAEVREQIAEIELRDNRDAEQKARLLSDARDATRRVAIIADALLGVGLGGGKDADYLEVAALATNATREGEGRGREDAWRQMEEQAHFALTDARGNVRRPAHFPLLFPEVFAGGKSGFDAVIGNPPFLGGQKLTSAFGVPYREHLVRDIGDGARGSADLVAYMFLTAARLCDRDRGGFGLIATNTVAQGDTREVGLDQIVKQGFEIYAAVKSSKWPTRGANLEYSIVWSSRRPSGPRVRSVADGERVSGINTTLEPAGRTAGSPSRLRANSGLIFQGSNVVGMGFTLTEPQAQEFIAHDPRNAEVLLPFVNGEDLNSRPDCSGSRWIINFRDWDEVRAQQYPDCYAYVVERVKPERDKNARENYRRFWWRYGEHRPGLYKAIEHLSTVMAITLVSKVVMPVRVPTGQVFSHATGVFASDDFALFALLSSAIHYWWAVSHASTLETRIRYTPSDVFETLPLPALTDRMRGVGEALYEQRRQFMFGRAVGLTKTYNLVHDRVVIDQDVVQLRQLHSDLDDSVIEAYGWDDVVLGHDHHDTRQGVRWTISLAARVEIMDRLLELNHARHADEEAQPEGAKVPRPKSLLRRAEHDQGSLFDEDD